MCVPRMRLNVKTTHKLSYRAGKGYDYHASGIRKLIILANKFYNLYEIEKLLKKRITEHGQNRKHEPLSIHSTKTVIKKLTRKKTLVPDGFNDEFHSNKKEIT